MAAVALSSGGRRPEAVRLFVASAGNHVMGEIAAVFASGFAANGVPADVAVDVLPEAAPADGLLQVVVAPHEFYPLFAAPRAPGHATAALPAVHLLNVEQPGSPWFESACWYARGAAGVLDINAMSAAELRRRGMAALHAPFGYVPPPPDAAAAPARDVDVVFLGVATPRREMFFARHAGFFAARRCRIHLARIEQPRLSTTPGFVTGPALARLLRSSRVLLNVHGEPSAYFEWHRTLLAVANGCAVVSEAGDPAPLQAGEDLVIEELDRLVEECRRLLDDEEARAAMAERARRRAEEELGAAVVCRRVLETITVPDRGRGAVAPSPRPRASAPVRAWPGVVAGVARGIAARLDAMTARPAPPAGPVPAAPPDPSVRQAAARAARREEARRLALAGHPLSREEANAAARGAETPGVTVTITVFNYEAHVGEALRSACAARTEGIPGGIEVVVVDDGSSDDSAAVVQAAMAASTTPVRLIRKALNTGLADARNLGLREARAPYVFVLDADNWIYPRCLSVLHQAIRDGGHDAVYAIIRKFDQRGEAAGLASCFAWDEREVVRRPYVDAMAMFDRSALLAVDGYSTDLEWMGWEDYDLWLKLALAGRSCALVPELLSAYRVHPASMIHQTNRHAAELARLFRRKFAALALRHPDAPMLFGFPRE